MNKLKYSYTYKFIVHSFVSEFIANGWRRAFANRLPLLGIRAHFHVCRRYVISDKNESPSVLVR